ncbi:UNVERIFIED_CONTAM: protein REVEILLE 6 [Sesamum angustifolium]|uniref:Protein REVEILLE 6 n=1 Tax=Sesamum angustifolium TaxID=2727405 RepID=A0AAW2N7M7_9LAMI
MGGDPMKITGVNRSDGHLLLATAVGNVCSAVDDTNKKIRKPYTITKSRESWSEQEHDKFLEALQLFDRDWKKIEAFVGSKTVIQIRSHAQKYFLKVQKNGTSEHVPPPRPKRKAAHPYPQKAPKNVLPQATGVLQPSAALESGYAVRPDSLSIPRKQLIVHLSLLGLTMVYQQDVCHILQKVCFLPDDTGLANNYSSSSNESTPRVWTSDGTQGNLKVDQYNTARVMPDFAQVYHFIGSVFDPCASDHLQRLKKMEPINVETVLMFEESCSQSGEP